MFFKKHLQRGRLGKHDSHFVCSRIESIDPKAVDRIDIFTSDYFLHEINMDAYFYSRTPFFY